MEPLQCSIEEQTTNHAFSLIFLGVRVCVPHCFVKTLEPTLVLSQ
jgi:hypothetical protein